MSIRASQTKQFIEYFYSKDTAQYDNGLVTLTLFDSFYEKYNEMVSISDVDRKPIKQIEAFDVRTKNALMRGSYRIYADIKNLNYEDLSKIREVSKKSADNTWNYIKETNKYNKHFS